MTAVLLAGMAAGTVNTIVGSGTLITFPTLVAFGVPPLTANVSNNVGLVPGSVAGAYGYRRELAGQRGRAIRLGGASLSGSVLGAVLLLVLDEDTFDAVVPVLILGAVVLVALQPVITRRVAARAETRHRPAHGSAWVWATVFGAGVYGGYFGAAQGVILLAVLGVGLEESLQRTNALKNVLAAVVNGVAGVVFALAADVDWRIAGLIAVGATVGGFIGAHVGRRLSPALLRGAVVLVGCVAAVSLVLR